MDVTNNPITRDERQAQCVNNWLRAKGRASIEAVTGFGKTRTALLAIQRIKSKYPDISVLVVVPTRPLKDQWMKLLLHNNLGDAQVEVINTVVKNNYDVDLLILDEEHRYAAESFSKVFHKVKYKLILGLTGTFERLDGKHTLIQKYCPIVDRITAMEALVNKWISEYTEYEVLLDVDNIDEYKAINKEFISHFEFFGFDFQLAMSFVGNNGLENRKTYTSAICKDESKWLDTFKQVTLHAVGFNRTMRAKKNFINNHSKKIEVARKIIEARADSKIITFSTSKKIATAIGMDGIVYVGQMTDKKSKQMLSEFAECKSGVLHSCAKLNEGLDCPGLNVAIVLGLDSSSSKAIQRLGRCVRFEEGKHAEVFNLVINDSQDSKWFADSHERQTYIQIDEENLYKVLRNEPFETYKKPISKFNFRF